MTDPVAVFAAAFAALYAAHVVADHWVQTGWQAANKGRRDHTGRRACAAHVATYAVTQGVFLVVMEIVTRIALPVSWSLAGLTVSAVTHYWADRRFTLAGLANRLGKGDFYRLGAPRTGLQAINQDRIAPDGQLLVDQPAHVDNPCLGTGAYALDQSFHIGCLFIVALMIAGGTAWM